MVEVEISMTTNFKKSAEVTKSQKESHSKQRPSLILMLRWPAAGRCKTRLAEKIGSQKAACIQNRINIHTIAVAQILEKQGFVDIQLAWSGLSYRAAKRWSLKQGIQNVILQGEGGLGLLMKKQVLHAQKHKIDSHIGRSIIIIGSDLPSLCKLDLIKAIESLKKHEIVLGPSSDGGYWLIGLSGKLVSPVASWPFIGINWGTSQVLTQTINKAKLEGVSHMLLGEHNDVDQLEDLSPWQG